MVTSFFDVFSPTYTTVPGSFPTGAEGQHLTGTAGTHHTALLHEDRTDSHNSLTSSLVSGFPALFGGCCGLKGNIKLLRYTGEVESSEGRAVEC